MTKNIIFLYLYSAMDIVSLIKLPFAQFHDTIMGLGECFAKDMHPCFSSQLACILFHQPLSTLIKTNGIMLVSHQIFLLFLSSLLPSASTLIHIWKSNTRLFSSIFSLNCLNFNSNYEYIFLFFLITIKVSLSLAHSMTAVCSYYSNYRVVVTIIFMSSYWPLTIIIFTFANERYS